jgi:hypothetical protein
MESGQTLDDVVRQMETGLTITQEQYFSLGNGKELLEAGLSRCSTRLVKVIADRQLLSLFR